MYIISCTRFNTDTYNENIRWIENNNYTGCIYNTPVRIKEDIPLLINIIVIEMNNTTNKIVGFGLIENKVIYDKYYKIYSIQNYNRYTYKGKYKVDVELLREKIKINGVCDGDDDYKWIDDLEKSLFKGKRHFKRGQGIQRIPSWILKDNKILLNKFEKLFISQFDFDINN
jgi:hypothetical protein